MSNLPKPTPQTSTTERIKANMIFLIVAGFILYLFSMFLKFIFSPLKVLSSREVADKIDAKIEEKRAKRLQKRRVVHPNDPMEQFYLRFIDRPEDFKNDPDNELYFAWFDAWKKGKVIDSVLRWAPDILDDDGESVRSNFIQYMKIQWALHKRASFLQQMQFTNTIFRFYPEFSANLRGLEADLAQYESENEEEAAERELREEIQAFGLSEGIAEYLVNKDINAKTLREEILILKKWAEKEYNDEACITALEQKYEDENAVKIIDMITSKPVWLPARVGIARIRNDIDDEQLNEIIYTMKDLCETWGSDIHETALGSNQSHYDQFVDAKLKEFKGKKVLKFLED
jgi:hypothetical protein